MSTKVTVSPKTPASTPVLETPVKAVKTTKPRKSKVTVTTAEPAPVAPLPAVVTEVAVPASVEEEAETPAVVKPKRQRPKTRSFTEMYSQIMESIDVAYKALQVAHREIARLENAHKRELNTTKTRESGQRRPTIVFDDEMVAYYRLRLDANELVVTNKGDEGRVAVSLSGLDTSTRVHRTDMTQLFSLIFKKHHMQDPEDGRNVLYKQDPELVKLLVSSPNAELANDVAAIRDGTFKLTIFNIQKFVSHHLRKVAP